MFQTVNQETKDIILEHSGNVFWPSTIVLDTIKNNQAFKDFVDSLKSLEPNNDQIKNLYNLDSYKVIDKKSTRAYVKYIKFGV